MEYARLKKLAFFWNRRNKFTRLYFDGGYSGKRYTLWVRLSEEKEPGIGEMEIPLSLRILSITLNAMMTQTNNISCGGTYQS